MDGVVIYFGEAQLQDVRKELAESLSEGAVLPYDGEEWKNELEAEEVEKIVQMLGKQPTCAVAVACRHGQQARDALSAVAMVMAKFPSSILDDDYDHLWTAKEVVLCEVTAPSEGLYALRTAECKPPGIPS